MKYAPFLLQAFAARVLAAKQQVTVSRAELVKQGFDVEMLVEMIESYMALPEGDRGFLVSTNATEIFIKRKPGAAPPIPPAVATSQGTAASARASKDPFPQPQLTLSDLVIHSIGTRTEKPPPPADGNAPKT